MLAIEVAFESIDVSRPEPAERSQPRIYFAKRLWLQSIEPALCVHRGFHESGVAQDSQVFGHGWLRDTKLALDLSHRLLRRDQESQDGATVRLSDDFEG